MIVADEPRAALIGRDVLARGGTAADAAVATALAMTVTLPSRVGLGGGGACLVYDARPDPDRGFRQIGEIPPEEEAPDPVVIDFLPRGAPSGPGDNSAALPALMRGLLYLKTQYGVVPWQEPLSRAERMARLGTPMSRSLARDLVDAEGTIRGDAALASVFTNAQGQLIDEGEPLTQPQLAATLARLRVAGVGDLHGGDLASRIVRGAANAGLSMSAEGLRSVTPTTSAPIAIETGRDTLLIAPQAALAGNAMADAFRGQAVNEVSLPVSASVVAMSEDMAVACGFTMTSLFGSGQMAPGTGILLAAAPRDQQPVHGGLALLVNEPLTTPLLAASGADSSAALAAPVIGLLLEGRGLVDAVAAPRSSLDGGISAEGRAAVIHCAWDRGEVRHCQGAADPLGFGLAVAIGG